MSGSDAVTVALDIEVEPEMAFAVFTRELDTWWGRGPQYRFLAPYQGTLVLEPGVGGRLLHVADEAAGRVFVVGQGGVGAAAPPGPDVAAPELRARSDHADQRELRAHRRRHPRQRHPQRLGRLAGPPSCSSRSHRP